MRTIFSKTALFATLMAVLFSSCIMSENCLINDPDTPITGADAALFVRVVDNPQVRSTAPIPPGTPLVLNEGNIYLVDANGVIVHHFIIVSADGDIESGTITRYWLSDGVLLPGVSDRVREVVIIGNTPKETHTGNVDGSLIGGRLLNVLSQYNAQDLNLFGREDLPPAPDSEGVYRVTVHLSPTVARMELPSISGMGMIESFVVEGVFINHYHQTATVSGTIPNINNAPNLRSHTDVAAFAYNAPGTSFTTASNNALFYWHETANAGEGFHVSDCRLTVRPSNRQTNVFHPNLHGGGSYAMRDHVWGFQVFAKNYGETTTPATEAPQMVIRLNDIRLTDGNRIDEPRFITIGGLYRRENGNIVPITHIRASNVYHILGGIVFDETDLGEIPGDNEISVEVVITLAVWGGGNVYQTLRQPNPPAMLQINAGTGATLYLGAAHPAIGVTYQWQISTDDGDTWEDIEGATERNYTIPAGTLTEPVYFRRVATLGSIVSFTNPVWVDLERGSDNTEYYIALSNDFSVAGVDFTMIEVEGGVFQRGLSPTTSVTPIRWVRVDDFRIAQTQVTRALYTAVMRYSGLGLTPVTFGAFSSPTGQNDSNLAANHISWYDAVVFMNRLSVLSGLTPVFRLNGDAANLLNVNPPTTSNAAWNAITMDADANGFRFPTESEWEYAARGGQMNEFTRTLGASGTNFNFSGSNTATAVAWHSANAGGQVRAVATLAPNELGIYDMSGNVREWCWDWFAAYPSGTAVLVNPTGPATGSARVNRGGSRTGTTSDMRVARRINSTPQTRDHRIGLRVALP